MQDNTSHHLERNRIRRMFDAIAFRYDCINRILSFRRDVAWRKQLVASFPERHGLRALDLATGTGDVLLTLLKQNRQVALAVGADISESMLGAARLKIQRAGFGDRCGLLAADAAALSFLDASFDVVTVAFGVRNFSELEKGLAEIRRMLRSNGRVLILEFSLPTSAVLRMGYLFYFRYILPFVAGIISRNPDAYRYLNATVEAFPYGDAFCQLMVQAGFTSVQWHPLTFGIATLYIGHADPNSG